MQGLADGYFVLPATIGDYLAGLLGDRPVPTDDPAFREAERPWPTRRTALLGDQRARRSVDASTGSWARSCGTTAAWPAAREGLEKAIGEIPPLREEFWTDVRVAR